MPFFHNKIITRQDFLNEYELYYKQVHNTTITVYKATINVILDRLDTQNKFLLYNIKSRQPSAGAKKIYFVFFYLHCLVYLEANIYILALLNTIKGHNATIDTILFR